MNATDILMKQVFKSLGIDGDQFLKMAGSTVQTVLELKAQLDRIEASQKLILDHLNIDVPPVTTSIVLEGTAQ